MSQGNNSKKLALLIACDRYADPELKQLQAPPKDAEALQRILDNPKIGGFKVTPFINQPYWIIKEKIDEFLQSCNREDTVLLYFSCHGIKDKNGHLYFATINTNRKRLLSTGIESNFVNNALDHCRAQQKVVLLDCCYSGAFEKGRIVRADRQINATEFFGRGNVVITASDSMQYAFEDDKIESLRKGGSYFTSALIEGVETGRADVNNDGKITYSELYNYVHDYVRKIIPDQTPTLNTSGVKGDFVIFNNPSATAAAATNQGLAKSTVALTMTRPDEHAASDEAYDSIFLLIRKARTFLEEEQQYDKAIMLFDSALLLNPGHVEALNGKGVALCRQKRYEEALECFKAVLKIRPRHPEASTYVDMIIERISVSSSSNVHNSKANSSDNGAKHDDDVALENRTEKKVIDALKKSTQIPAELIKKGDQLYEKGKYQEAILCYDRALEIEPLSELAWNSKGNALDKKGQYEEALSCFKEALKIKSNSQIYRDNIRTEVEKLGQANDSQYDHHHDDDDHVPGADPRNPYNDPTLPGYNPTLDSTARTDDQDISKLYDAGMTNYELGEFDKALEYFEKVLKMNPSHYEASINKNLALKKIKDNKLFVSELQGEKSSRGEYHTVSTDHIYQKPDLHAGYKAEDLKIMSNQKELQQYHHDDDDHVPGADPRNPFNDPTLPGYNPNLGKKDNNDDDDDDDSRLSPYYTGQHQYSTHSPEPPLEEHYGQPQYQGQSSTTTTTAATGADLEYLKVTYLKENRSLRGADLRGRDLRGGYLHGRDLYKADLEGANLEEVDLTRCNLKRANLYKAKMSAAKLYVAELSNANLSGADLRGANLTLADLSKGKLMEAKLEDANLYKANLSKANLRRANLKRANLESANLKRANLSEADLSNVKLDNANFSGANLSNTKVSRHALIRAKIGGKHLSEADIDE